MTHEFAIKSARLQRRCAFSNINRIKHEHRKKIITDFDYTTNYMFYKGIIFAANQIIKKIKYQKELENLHI